MTIGHAISFIERGLKEKALRGLLNSASNASELSLVLAGENLTFSPEEFDEAFHGKLTQYQVEEQADQIKEFKLWWDLVNQDLGLTSCGASCSGRCGE